MDARERRLAENEVLFRRVNESVEEVALEQPRDEHVFRFLCECSNPDCTLQLPLTLAECARSGFERSSGPAGRLPA